MNNKNNRVKNFRSFLLVAPFLAALTLLLSSLALAGGYGAGGCGLGSQIFKKNSFVSQTFAMSTNQYFGVSSSITSGTSGCDAKGFVQNDSSGQILYAEQNLESLTEEMAAGAGERLVAFSQVMGCAGTQGAKAFADMTREKFSSLVPSAEISAENLVQAVRREIAADFGLQVHCQPAPSMLIAAATR